MLGVVLSIIILLLVFWVGVSSGIAKSQAQVTFEQAKQIKQAMDYFYNDNNRYPTDVEFADQNIMSSYFRNFPAQQFNSSVCPQSFVYKQLSADSYQLNFCLETAVSGFGKGWNGVEINYTK